MIQPKNTSRFHQPPGLRYPRGLVRRRPQSWLPEACVWLETETGLRRLWVRSFAHCFDAEKLTFPKLDADSWALGAARTIIDRALEQLKSSVAPAARNRRNHGWIALRAQSAAGAATIEELSFLSLVFSTFFPGSSLRVSSRLAESVSA